MAVRNLVILAGQSNMEGVAGAGALLGLNSALRNEQTAKVWNQRRGTETARAITAVTFDPNRWVTIDMATPHGCVWPVERKVPVTIANNTGAGAAAINGTHTARIVGALEGVPVTNRVTIDFSANPRSGSPVVDGEIYVGGPGAFEALNAELAVHNNHSEWPLLGASFGYFGPEMRLAWLLWGQYGLGNEPYILKLSPPGSSLAPGHGSAGESPKSSWHPDETGDQWYELWQRVRDASRSLFDATGDTLKCRALFWIQGEADATDLGAARAYEANWRRFIEAFRAKLALSKASELAAYGFDYTDPFPIVACGIASNQTGETDTERFLLVRNALRDVGIGDSAYHYFDAFGKPRFDGVHFDSNEVEQIAYGMHEAYKAAGGLEAELADEEELDTSDAAMLARCRRAKAELMEYGVANSLEGTNWQGLSLGDLQREEQIILRRMAGASGAHRTYARVGRVR